jgi:hypothetical protein
LRPCGDYQRLNLQTVHDRYPIPHIWDFTSILFYSNFILQEAVHVIYAQK